METLQILQRIDLRSDAVAILIVVAAILLFLYINRQPILRRFREWRQRRELDRLGCEQILNFRCPDGLDGYYHVDRLVLTGSAILLINHKPFGGNIFCAERIDQWTQVIGRKSFKFDNPLFDLHHQQSALQALVGKAELRAYVYFDPSASFPKGHPPSVLRHDNIPQAYLGANCQHPRPDIQVAWERLKAVHREWRDGGQTSGEEAGA